MPPPTTPTSTSAAAPPASKRRRCGERSGMNGLQFERVGLGRALAMGDAEQRGDEEQGRGGGEDQPADHRAAERRSEEHTSELQSLMRISYAVFCLKKKKHAHHYCTTQKNDTTKTVRE